MMSPLSPDDEAAQTLLVETALDNLTKAVVETERLFNDRPSVLFSERGHVHAELFEDYQAMRRELVTAANLILEGVPVPNVAGIHAESRHVLSKARRFNALQRDDPGSEPSDSA